MTTAILRNLTAKTSEPGLCKICVKSACVKSPSLNVLLVNLEARQGEKR